MKTFTINIPDNLNIKATDISIYLAAKMYEDGMVSLGQAAEIVGLSKRTFLELLGKYGVSAFSNSLDDLKNDIKNA